MADKLIIEIVDQGADKAIQKLDALKTAAVSLGKELTALKSGSSALNELKTALAGTKQGATALEELGAAMKQLNVATNSMKSTLSASIRGLGTILKSEMNQLREVVKESGMGIGKGIGDSVGQGFKEAGSKAKTEGQKLAATIKAVRAEVDKATNNSTSAYSKYSASSGRAGNLANPVRQIIGFPSSAELAKGAAEVIADAKTAQARVQAQVKAATIQAGGDYSSLSSGRTFRVRNAELFMNMPSKAEWQEAAAKAVAEATAMQARVQAQVKAATIQAGGDYSSLSSGRTFRVRNAELFMNMPSKAEWQEAVAKAVAESKAAQAQVTAAMNNAAGQYSQYNPSTGLKGRTISPQLQPVPQVRSAVDSTASAVLSGGPKPAEIDSMSAAMRRLAVTGNDVHSMSRGLASGFGALWLTWGNLLPLFAGAAISNGFMKTAKEGLEVSHTLSTIAILGENTTKEMSALTAEMINLGTQGPHGPLAIAEAMKTLSLAGLKAGDILAVTRETMNFSMAGTTSIQTAADVLVSVTTAFGTGAQGFARSADIIMRAAADSKASVESFGEAMKTASVVGAQYGATQEDVAQQIQYLANLGIQGSAAGTAIRNMYADITGRSGQVTKILKTLGLDFKTASGEVVGLKDMTSQLMSKLSEYDPKSQGAILQAIFGERGAKSMIASLAAANTFILDENGKMVSKLELDQKKLANSYGDSAVAAIHMAQTTQNAFKTAGATLETTLFKAFTAMEPQLYATAKALQKAFNSPELLTSLSTLVSTLATIAQVVVENIGQVGKLVLAYVGFKAAIALSASAYGLLQGVMTAVAAAKAIQLARTTAQTAAELAHSAALGVRSAAEVAAAQASAASAAAAARNLTVAGGLLRILPGVGTAIMVVVGAWMAYSLWAKRAAGSTKAYTDEKSDDIIASLHKEANEVKELTRLQQAGLSAAEATAAQRARVNIDAARSSGQAEATTELAKAETAKQKIADLEAKRIKAQGQNRSLTAANLGLEIADQQKIINASEASAAAALKTAETKAKNIEIANEFVKDAYRERNAFDKAQLEKQKAIDAENLKIALPGGGTKSWDLSSWQGENGSGFGGKGKKSDADNAKDKEKQELENFYATTMKGMSDSARAAEISTLGLSESYKNLIKIVDDPLYQKLDEPLKKEINAAAALAIIKEQDAAATKKQMAATQAAIVVQEQLDDVAKGYARTLAAIGMGKNEQEKANGLNSIRDKYDTDLRALRKGPTEEFDEKFAALKDFHAKSQLAYAEYYNALKVKEGDWRLGAQNAMRSYADDASNVFAQTESAVTNAFKGMEDALVSFAMTGKLDFKSLANSIIADLIRIQIRAAAVSFLSSMFSSMAGGWQAAGVQSSGAVTSPVAGYGSTVGTALPPMKMAKGGAFNSSSLSAYRNEVHSSPKTFAFAKGAAGVFGEAGPEAIMPLTRTSDGNLGVRAIGGTGSSSSGDIKIEIINNGAPAEATATSEKQPDGSVMIRVILQAVAEDMSSGGMTARATAGRFGLANN